MSELETIEKLADTRQSSNLLDKQSDNIGIVKGIQQKAPELSTAMSTHPDGISPKLELVKDRKFQADSSENLLDLYSQRLNNSNNSNYSNSSSSPVTSIGVSGSLKPPAYRNPPAPKTVIHSNGNFSPIFSPNDIPMQNVQYRDLVQLIKYQREKINTQQSDLTKVNFLSARLLIDWIKILSIPV